MPLYEFKCKKCLKEFCHVMTWKESEAVNDSDCPFCNEECGIKKMVSSGSFVVNGYNAANGYATSGRKGK